MDRVVKFRGLRIDGKGFIFGGIQMFPNERTYIIKAEPINAFATWEVKPETVGQFTGLVDKNGTDIYGGDCVDFVGGTTHNLYSHNGEYHTVGTSLIVKKLKSGFTLMLPRHAEMKTPNIVGNVPQYTFWSHARSLVVTGNIHDKN